MRSLILGTAVIAVSAFSPAEMAHAADLKVLSSVALTSVLDELIPAFEKASGNKLNIGYGLAAELKKRILDGEMADVIILTRPMMDEVQKQNKFLANSVVTWREPRCRWLHAAALQSQISARLTPSSILS